MSGADHPVLLDAQHVLQRPADIGHEGGPRLGRRHREALYKSKKCMVDEGNGRHTPCEALLKQKKTPAANKK